MNFGDWEWPRAKPIQYNKCFYQYVTDQPHSIRTGWPHVSEIGLRYTQAFESQIEEFYFCTSQVCFVIHNCNKSNVHDFWRKVIILLFFFIKFPVKGWTIFSSWKALTSLAIMTSQTLPSVPLIYLRDAKPHKTNFRRRSRTTNRS